MGEYHKENGPVEQIWNENGQTTFILYSLFNINYTREQWIKKLKEINSPHYKEQKLIYDADQFNL